MQANAQELRAIARSRHWRNQNPTPNTDSHTGIKYTDIRIPSVAYTIARLPARNARQMQFVTGSASRDALVGVTVPFGVHAFLTSYIYKDDRTVLNQNVTQIARGYRYALSKRAEFNVANAKIDNRNGASYTVGSAIKSGAGERSASARIRNAF